MDELRLVPPGHPALRTVSAAFDFEAPPFNAVDFARSLVTLMRDMDGIGLAANQVGVLYRVFAMRGDPNQCLFNPRVVVPGDDIQLLDEGCLTWPGLMLKVKRPKVGKVRFQMANGEVVTETYMGMTARVFQHELDHLDGITFLQRANRYYREKGIRQWERRKRLGQSVKLEYRDEVAG